MKKVYSKPEIIIENFTLTANIAGSCELIINNSTKYVCAYHDVRNNKFVFTSDIGACTTQQESLGNGICYHVPIETSNLFNS